MGWPLSQEYNEAVQNPRTSFGDPDLRGGEAVPGPLGIPMPRSGNFADVYQIRGADGRLWALKCFTRPAAQLRERYVQIDAHLRDARLPFSVGFEFLPQGVRIRGLWYPALKMEWVEGLQLNSFVKSHVSRPDDLKALLGMWVRLCKRLRDARIAHADLQHGNVLLVPGSTANTLKLRLIDYDGMWVPALAGNPSGEAGHPAFQHPARLRDRSYSPDVDRFPHLVIGCALRALVVAGKQLWDRHDNGDNLLFREADFADPRNSKFFRALWDLDDPTVTNLAALLVVSAQRPIEDTPWLDEVLSGDQAAPVNNAVLARAADVLGVPRRIVRQSVPVAQLYVVPDQANTFADMDAWSAPTRSGRKRHRSVGAGVFMAVGAAVLLAAAAVVTAIAMSGGRTDSSSPVQAPPAENEPAKPSARSGLVETRWTRIDSGEPAAPVKALVSGIDVAPPGSKIIRAFPLKGAAALGAWLLPDGRHAVVAGRDGIGVLDLHTGQVLPISSAKLDLVRAALDPNGKHVVAAGRDQNVLCFDVQTGELLWSQKFPGAVTAVATAPDGQRAAASGEGAGYIEWNIRDGVELRRHESLQARHFVFGPDGKIALAATEASVELWSLDDARITTLSPAFAASVVDVSPDGKLALAAGPGPTIKAWDLPDGQPQPDRPCPLKQVHALRFGPGRTLLLGNQHGEVALVGHDETTSHFTAASESPIAGFSATADALHVLIATEKSDVVLSRLADLVRPDGSSPTGPTVGCLEFVRSLPTTPEFIHFAADASGERFLAASGTRVVVYDATRFQRIDGTQLTGGRIVSAGFGHDGTVVICEAEGDRFRTRAWDLKKAQPLPRFSLPDGDPGRITRIVSVPHRPWALATTESAGDVLFDTQTGDMVEGWPPTTKARSVAAPSLDGRQIAIGSEDEPVRIWGAEAGAIERRCEASTGVCALAFTPDSRDLVGLWPQGRLRVWNPETGKVTNEVDHDYPGPFSELAAIGNGVLLIGSASSRMLLHVETGRAMSTGNGPDPLAGRGVAVPARGWVLAADRDERLTAWRVNSKLAASLPFKPPPRRQWPDITLVRDAPTAPPVGLAIAPDGKSVIVATQSGKLSRYRTDRLSFESETEARDAPLVAMARSQDRLFTMGRRSIIVSYDAETLERKAEFPTAAPKGSDAALFAVHPEGSLFLSVTDRLRVMDTTTKKEIAITAFPKAATGKPLTHFAYSANGKSGLARWGDALTAVWHPKLSGAPRTLEELRTPVPASPQALAISPDGRVAILGTGDGRLKAWDTSNGSLRFNEEVYRPVESGEAIAAVAFTPDGKRCLSAGRDGRIILWELDGFQRVKEYRGPAGPWRLDISSDGRVAILVQSGLMQRIDLPPSPE